MHASECLERDDEARSCACALALQDPQAEIVKQGEVIVDIPALSACSLEKQVCCCASGGKTYQSKYPHD